VLDKNKRTDSKEERGRNRRSKNISELRNKKKEK
jgi:hypothetical protein